MRILVRVFGVLAVLIGLSTLGWIAYNLLVEKRPEAQKFIDQNLFKRELLAPVQGDLQLGEDFRDDRAEFLGEFVAHSGIAGREGQNRASVMRGYKVVKSVKCTAPARRELRKPELRRRRVTIECRSAPEAVDIPGRVTWD